MKRCITTLFVALVAFPSAALALPPEEIYRGDESPPVVHPESAGLASRLPAVGTDVAAPDQQASKPAPVSESANSGLDWADAGLMSGAALAAFAIAGAVGVRRRRAAPLAG